MARASPPGLALDYFVNRAKILSLYRKFIRTSRSMGELDSRREALRWVRADFDRAAQADTSARVREFLAQQHRDLKRFSTTAMLVGGGSSKFRGGTGTARPS